MKRFILFYFIFSIVSFHVMADSKVYKQTEVKKTSIMLPEIEIKGLKIGMTLPEVSNIVDIKKHPSEEYYYLSGDRITIGGQKIFDLKLEFEEGKLDYVKFSLYSSDFEIIQKALKEKYPDIICSEQGKLQNQLGASYDQMYCTLEGKSSSLLFKRYFENNIERSHLFINSNKRIEKAKKIADTAKKDI